jgi:hypothetical protein
MSPPTWIDRAGAGWPHTPQQRGSDAARNDTWTRACMRTVSGNLNLLGRIWNSRTVHKPREDRENPG